MAVIDHIKTNNSATYEIQDTVARTKANNLESANYTDIGGGFADGNTLLFKTNDGMKKGYLNNFANWILDKLATKVYNQLSTSNKTMIGALNELDSKVFINTRNLSTFSVNIRLNKNTYTSFLMYGATSQNNGFMYIVFINVASEKRTVNFIKIADFVANRTFSGTYSDDTSTLTINASETIWGGIKMLMFKEENY